MTLAEARAHSERVLSDKRLNADLRRKVIAVLRDVNGHATGGWQLFAFEGWRSPLRQLKLFWQGFSKLRHGKHCLGKAVDVVFVVNGAWSWDSRLPWHLVGSSARAHGLTSGVFWKFYDPAHVELR